MSTAATGGRKGIRYQPDERPPPALAFGLGAQIAVLTIAGIILVPTIVMRAAGASEDYLSWAVFGTVAICGLTTALQSIRTGRIGSGHVLIMGASGAFIAVCINAIAAGGPALLATLVIISSLVPLLISVRLALFQRILTPTVSGTVIMLIPVTVMPAVFKLLGAVPEGSPALAAPLSALAVVLVLAAIALKASGALRLWAPVIGVVAGTGVAAAFGLYDAGRVVDAPWVGVPAGEWAGFDVEFGPSFWALLPAFLLVAVIATIRSISGAVAIQRVSWRRPRAVDFRAVQGAITVDGIGNVLSGLVGTTPNTATTVGASVTELTGVGARSVGIACGAVFFAAAFLPKLLALVLAIPGPVIAAYLGVLLATLFVIGMRIAIQDGIDYRKGLIVGRLVLDRGRLPERPCVSRAHLGIRRRSPAQRGHGRRGHGHPDDLLRGVDQTPPQPHGGGIRPLGPAEDQGFSRRLRDPQRLGRGNDDAAGRRLRRDAADPDPT